MKLRQLLPWLLVAVFFFGPIWWMHGPFITLMAVAMVVLFFLLLYALRLILHDEFNALLVLLLFFVIVSFLPKLLILALTFIMVCLALIIALPKKGECLSLARHDLERIITMPLFDKLIWYLIFILISPLGFFAGSGFFAFDTIHPINDLSVGNSYSFSFFQAPDLAYAGRGMKTYFLGTRQPHYWSALFNLPTLTTTFLITPLFFLLYLYMLLAAFFTRCPQFKLPVFFLFFLPLFSFHLYHYQGFGLHYFFHSYTYSLAYILSIFTIIYLAEGQTIKIICLALLLLLTKISFFAPILLGIALFYLRKLEFKKLFFILMFLLPLALFFYKVFVAGSHGHNLWVIFPTLLYIKVPGILLGTKMVFSKPHLITTFIPLTIYGCIIYSYIRFVQDKFLLSLSSVALAGVLIPLGLTEVIEFNSIFFYVAVFFPAVLVFYYIFRRFINRFFGHWQSVLVGTLALLVAGSIYFSSFMKIVNNLNPITPPAYSNELIRAYTWLRENSSKKSVILFGKHYETDSQTDWQESTTFIRSALSERQMFLEGGYYRGLIMHKDFSKRFADVVFFYKNFVSSKSVLLDSFFASGFGLEKGKPLLDYLAASPRKKIFAKLSFNKQWSGLNIEARFEHDVKAQLKQLQRLSLSEREKWLLDFIGTSGIDYVVLERGERPTHQLRRFATQVYKSETITILRLKNCS